MSFVFFGWFLSERSQTDFLLVQLLIWNLLPGCPAAIVAVEGRMEASCNDGALSAALERAAAIVKLEEYGCDAEDNASIFCQ